MFAPMPSRDTYWPGCSGRGAVWYIRLNLVLFAFVAVAVAVLCLLPGADVPSIGLGDKVEHIVAYALLAVLGLNAFPGGLRWVVVLVFLLAFGLLLEYLQSFVPGRSADLIDIVANICGTIAGGLLQIGLRCKLQSATRLAECGAQLTNIKGAQVSQVESVCRE